MLWTLSSEVLCPWLEAKVRCLKVFAPHVLMEGCRCQEMHGRNLLHSMDSRLDRASCFCFIDLKNIWCRCVSRSPSTQFERTWCFQQYRANSIYVSYLCLNSAKLAICGTYICLNIFYVSYLCLNICVHMWHISMSEPEPETFCMCGVQFVLCV